MKHLQKSLHLALISMFLLSPGVFAAGVAAPAGGLLKSGAGWPSEITGKTELPAEVKGRLHEVRGIYGAWLPRNDLVRLTLAEHLPGLMQTAVHARVQYVRRLEYLGFLLSAAATNGEEKSPLARQLATPGSEIQEAYLVFAGTDPGNTRDFGRAQVDFVMSMIHYIQATKTSAPDTHFDNLAFLADLLTRMKSIATVTVADLSGWARRGVQPDQHAFRVPARLIERGYRGALGAVTDLLRETAYEVRPQISRLFIPHWPRLFAGSS